MDGVHSELGAQPVFEVHISCGSTELQGAPNTSGKASDGFKINQAGFFWFKTGLRCGLGTCFSLV